MARNELFEPTANIMWTYKVTHIQWVGNQPLGLKLVFKPKGSLDSFIFHNRERWLVVFVRLNPVLVHSFLSVSEDGSFVWIAVEGGAICYAFQFDKED